MIVPRQDLMYDPALDMKKRYGINEGTEKRKRMACASIVNNGSPNEYIDSLVGTALSIIRV
jgi:hypothetical protein